MRASHILVKHQGSRRTASWKDVDGVDIKQRTKVREEQELRVRVSWCMCVSVLSAPAGALLLHVPFRFQWDFGNTIKKQIVG